MRDILRESNINQKVSYHDMLADWKIWKEKNIESKYQDMVSMNSRSGAEIYISLRKGVPHSTNSIKKFITDHGYKCQEAGLMISGHNGELQSAGNYNGYKTIYRVYKFI